MKKLMVFIMVLVFTFMLTASVSADNSVSFGTIGEGATATADCSAVELYTPAGLTGSGYVRLEIPDGIALSEITSLSYTAKMIALGPPFPGFDSFAPEVVLNIDADGADELEGTGIKWMLSSYDPNVLDEDNFLSGDNWPPVLTGPDTDFVTHDALGDYLYWSANDARDDLSPILYADWATVLSSKLPVHGIEATDKVYSIDFVVGTSGNFDGMRALFSSVELNETEYPLVAVLTTKACILKESGIPGKGLDNAPGLQKPFNPKSKAAENAGKK